jgi:hypothetical protein
MWVDIFEHPSGKLRLTGQAGVLRRLRRHRWKVVDERIEDNSLSKDDVPDCGYIVVKKSPTGPHSQSELHYDYRSQ